VGLAHRIPPGRPSPLGVEFGTTEQIFNDPKNKHTMDYIHGTFG
jgi:hypothetical protein